MLYVNLFNKIKYFLFIVLFSANCLASNTSNEVQKNNIKLINKTTNMEVVQESTKFIKNIIFKDNSKIKKEELALEIKFNKKSAFNEKLIKEDLERLKAFYIKKGFYDIAITYELKEASYTEGKNFVLEENVFDLVFVIKEGKKVKVNNISFVGNKVFSEEQLRAATFSKKYFPLLFLSQKHKFEESHKEVNEMFLAKFFLTRGYIDFKIISIVPTVFKDNENELLVDLVITLEEGAQFKLGSLSIMNNTGAIKDDLLWSAIAIKEGDVYNMDHLQQTLLKLSNVLKSNNISSYIKVEPNIMPDYSNNTINIQFVILEMPKKYIGSIKLLNNFKTYNYVVLDNINYFEGDIYTTFADDEIKSNLINTGFFEDVKILAIEDLLYKNKINLILDLKEKATGSMGMSFGWSTYDAFSLRLNLNNTNFFGKGLDFRINVSVSKYSKYLNLGFEKANILDTRFYGGINFNVSNDKITNNLSDHDNARSKMYNEQSLNITPFININLSKHIIANLYYDFEVQKLNDIGTLLKNVVNDKIEFISLVGTNFIYDTRNDYRYPLKGFYHNIDVKLAGLGGTKRFVELNLQVSNYLNLYKEIVFKSQIMAGYKTSYGNDDKYKLYPNDGFILNYGKIRGFDFGGINPRIPITNNDENLDYKNGFILGGTKYFVFNFDLIFPIIRKNGFGLFIVPFISGGTVFGIEKNKNVILPDTVKQEKMLRVAGGVGIVFQTPYVNFSIEFSNPIKYHENDNIEKFRFELGKTF